MNKDVTHANIQLDVNNSMWLFLSKDCQIFSLKYIVVGLYFQSNVYHSVREVYIISICWGE